MNLSEELTDRLTKVDESRKKISSLKDWWETNHQEDEPFLLSGTPGKDVWKELNILDDITANKKILNIGVGLGYCTKEMAAIGATVHALDISTAALQRVQNFVKGTWLPDQLASLPENYFDLAISHLVAQHMSDADLIDQIKSVVRSLKPGGFFAIQISFAKQKDYQFAESFDVQKWGGVHRSLYQINDLVNKAEGQIGWVDIIGDFPEFEVGWYGVHIIKNDSTGKLRLINVWATWCGPCAGEFPDLVTIDRMYRDRSFEFISISADKINKKDDVLKFLKKVEASNKNYIFNLDDVYKLIDAVDPKWQGGLPYTLLIEPGGKIVYRNQGTIDPAELKRIIVENSYMGRFYNR